MDPLFTPQSTLVFPLQLGFWLISKQNGIKNFQGNFVGFWSKYTTNFNIESVKRIVMSIFN